MNETWMIGNVPVEGRAVLAPLAGVSHLPFRALCRRYGAALAVSEMMSCHGLNRGQPNTHRLLAGDGEDHPVAFQLFGADPEAMARASLIAAQAGADVVDLNFGCPVPKVVRHRGGSALLKEPDLLGKIVEACAKVCPCPVTVKIRSGWDHEHINAPEIAHIAQEAGAAAIAVHGRSRAQKYEGQADWGIIAQVVRRVSIPVMGNGDVVDGPSAQAMLEQTGCTAVMVGRSALGRPWVFEHINHYLETGERLHEPGLKLRLAVIRELHQGLKQLKGERTARLEMRKHSAWILKGWPGAAQVRRQINTCEDEASFLALLDGLETEMSD